MTALIIAETFIFPGNHPLMIQSEEKCGFLRNFFLQKSIKVKVKTKYIHEALCDKRFSEGWKLTQAYPTGTSCKELLQVEITSFKYT